jgi:hypothetical protein
MYAIIVTGLDGSQTELCHVQTNPETVARAARKKKLRIGSRTMPQYRNVEIKEVHPHQEEAPPPQRHTTEPSAQQLNSQGN